MNPTLSIIVPVYNVCAFLEECIDSILAQTFTDYELIIVDDGSTDGSSEICDRYAQTDSRIKVIHKENGGLVSARKAGIKAASGTYA
ncbi:MAG: glycosyltransferase family 2 protein, partial [Hominilimicola sp.]